jgi:hypothetical protein
LIAYPVKWHSKTSAIASEDIINKKFTARSFLYFTKKHKQQQKSTDALNMAVKTKALYSDEMNYLASPLICTGLSVNCLEQLLLLTKSRKQNGSEFL